MARLRQSAAPRHLAPDPAWLAATLRDLDALLAAGEYQRAEETARAVALPERACGRRGAWADGCPACQAVDAVGIELAMREMAARLGVPMRHPSDPRSVDPPEALDLPPVVTRGERVRAARMAHAARSSRRTAGNARSGVVG